MQLVIDGFVKRVLPRLELKDVVLDCMDLIKVKPAGPFSYRQTYLGSSCIQMLFESHISIAYKGDCVMVTVFSCKDFNHHRCFEFLRDRLYIDIIIRNQVIPREFLTREEYRPQVMPPPALPQV